MAIKMWDALAETNKDQRKQDSEYMTVAEAAAFVKCSEVTIRRLLTQKKLTRYKFGARTLIKKSELTGLIRES